MENTHFAEEVKTLENNDIHNDFQNQQYSQNEAMKIIDFHPNQTLYVNNLNEKIKNDELKQTLYQLFSQFGEILEIHSRKSFKMRGQAFIVFKDLNSATSARHGLDKSLIFGKEMRVNFSKNLSDCILKLSGSYNHKEKLKRDAERRKRREEEYLEIKKKSMMQREKEIDKPMKKETTNKNQLLTPNNILFVENLTQDITESILTAVFSKYNGFKEVRLSQGKGIAFVEYDNEINAGAALLGLNNLHLTAECMLHISFAKK